jgi:prepilin-type N-terminal cleavage/methylation domain-containing protein
MNARGFALLELMVVAAIAGVLAVLAAPTLVSYARASALQAGARELATVINLGRQIAITQNTAVCVEVAGTNVRLRTGGCVGTLWTGPGTDGAGVIRISAPSALRISTTATVVFTNLGAAVPAGTYTVTHPVNNGTRTVVVAATGRVSVR